MLMLTKGLLSDLETIPNQWIVMQSTGLKDMAGIELFERDILKNDSGRFFEVRWNQEYAAFWLYEMDDGAGGTNSSTPGLCFSSVR